MSDYFVFGDVDSRDYSDIHVFDKSVDNTPKRVYEVQNIAGRNGAFYVDQGRYEDVEHSYGVVALTKSAGSNFINALVSQVGYHRLSDSFNEDEFYLATLTDAVEAKVSKSTRDVNTFDITFTRKPQRFLLSGEVPKLMTQNMVPSSTTTESGSIVSIESDGGDAVTSLIAQIDPVQAGSGDPSPTNVRAITGHTSANVQVAGKNLLDTSGMSTAGQSQAIFTRNADGSIYVGGKAVSTVYRIIGSVVTKAGVRYTLTGTPSGGGSGKYRMTMAGFGYDNGNGYTFTGDGKTHNISVDVFAGYPQDRTLEFRPMLRLATETDATYEPYKGHTVTVSFGSAGTVYGGTVHVVTGAYYGGTVGVLTVTHKAVDLGTLTWNANTASGAPYFLSSALAGGKVVNGGQTSAMCEGFKPFTGVLSDFARENNIAYVAPSAFSSQTARVGVRDTRYTDAASFKSAVSGVKLVYELATPQTYNLTAQQVELLTGNNNVWADTGDITLTYGADPYKVVNPTLFASKPLLRVTGHGVLTIGSQSITINGTSRTQVINIDCDTMEAWEMSGSAMIPRNDYIQNAGDDFPVLVPGANSIRMGTGISMVVMTPRWWRV